MTVEEYLQWKSEGLKDGEILEKLHYSSNSQPILTKWKKENGIGLTRQNAKKYTPTLLETIDVNRIKELRKQKLRRKEIAELLGISFGYYAFTLIPSLYRSGALERRR